MDVLSAIWARVQITQADPHLAIILATALLALAGTTLRRAWPLTRNLVTIAHEGGHALTALATGRRLAGIRLHSDTSGVTVSAGRPTGLGMVATAFAGYIAPSTLGATGAYVLHTGYVSALLWATVALLAGMFLMIRNAFGALSLLLTGGGIVAVSWWAPLPVQAAFGYLLVWFLLLAGPRPVYELQHKRRRGEAPDSDADQLAALTGIPGILWVTLFTITTLGAAALGAALLLT